MTERDIIPKTPSFRLDGKRALVTGAGRGLGRAAAHALATVGAHVIVVSRTMAELQTVVAEIASEGGSAEAVVCDMMDLVAVDDLVSNEEEEGATDVGAVAASTGAGAFLVVRCSWGQGTLIV